MGFDKAKLPAILEALIFVQAEPLSLNSLFEVLSERVCEQNLATISDAIIDEATTPVALESGGDVLQQLEHKQDQLAEALSKGDLREAIEGIKQKYQDEQFGIELVEVAGAYQFRTKSDMAVFVKALNKPQVTKLSKPAMETLAIIAYRQPLTKVEVEQLRGVDSGGVIKTLLEKDLLRIVGRKDEVGKPALYGTSNQFLELFSLKSVKDLPSLRELEEIEVEFRASAANDGTFVDLVDDEADEVEFQHRLSTMEADEKDDFLELETKLTELKEMEKVVFAKPEPEIQQDAGIQDATQ